jgi:hypothetical protein
MPKVASSLRVRGASPGTKPIGSFQAIMAKAYKTRTAETMACGLTSGVFQDMDKEE